MLKTDDDLKPGDIVQANPVTCEWGPCLVVVSEVKAFGIQGYTSVPMGGDAYIRLNWADIEPTGGRAEWIRVDTAQANDKENADG